MSTNRSVRDRKYEERDETWNVKYDEDRKEQVRQGNYVEREKVKEKE